MSKQSQAAVVEAQSHLSLAKAPGMLTAEARNGHRLDACAVLLVALVQEMSGLREDIANMYERAP